MPRTPRFLAPWVGQPNAGSAIYHCISRTVDRAPLFGEQEKEQFVRLMRLYERFCGVHVLTYSVMSNHFHILLEVPPRPKEELSDEELCERLAVLYKEGFVEEVRESLIRFRERGDEAGRERLRESFLYRRWNLSEFMKTLKQRFSKWFNKRHDRKGTLWEERFKNPLVEAGYGARKVAAYIDLNPIRAGIVDQPEDYRWCGYAEAVAGCSEARDGIERVMNGFERAKGGEQGPARTWSQIASAYRVILFTDGEERLQKDPVSGRVEVARRGISREEVEKVLARGGTLSAGQMLRCRVRAMTDGLVIGTESFVEKVFQAKREYFGPKRRSGSRPIHRCETDLCCARALRKDALG